MTNLVDEAKVIAKSLIIDAFNRLIAEQILPEVTLPEFTIEIPADKSHGDLAANAAMVSARVFRMAPPKIAAHIVDKLVLTDSPFSSVEIGGAGFINFFYSSQWFAQVLENITTEQESYGRTNLGDGKKILIEFVSANPTGPMHIGNARGGAIGDCLASVLDYAGYYVEREFYVNDAGNQIEKFGLSLDLRYTHICSEPGQKLCAEFSDNVALSAAIYGENGSSSDFPMPEDAYHGADIILHAKNFYDINGDKYMNTSESERRAALVAYALPINIAGLQKDLEKYRITYNTWYRESTLHNSGKVEAIINRLKERGCTYESEGALWFRSTDYGDEKDRVLVRSNGLPTYVVPDIAYHYNKLQERGFDIAIDILGADHHGYIGRMRAALAALDVDPDRLDIVIMQMVRLVRNGSTYKLSKRSGKAITLSTLIDEVPVDAARFFFNLREANSHFDFDLDLAAEQSSQNPVYYVQYAHARICSIIRNLNAEEITDCGNLNLLTEAQERLLIARLADFPSEINQAAATYSPSSITKYCIEIATLFHKFYDACRVNCDDKELMLARLCLCRCTARVIKNILTMFKIGCPEKM